MRKVSAGACLRVPFSVATRDHVSYDDWSVEIHRSARQHGIDDAELVIHAMKARPQYFDLLP
jgi:hypothetical protein